MLQDLAGRPCPNATPHPVQRQVWYRRARRESLRTTRFRFGCDDNLLV